MSTDNILISTVIVDEQNKVGREMSVGRLFVLSREVDGGNWQKTLSDN
jgi:hypothetical protein